MKKPKFLLKINKNNLAKVYLCGKWHTDIVELKVHGEPWNYEITLCKYVKANGKHVLSADKTHIETVTKTYHIGHKN